MTRPRAASAPSSASVIEQYLLAYPTPIVSIADELTQLVHSAAPTAVARLRPGWRLIGFDLPTDHGLRYFAYVAAEPVHVHLGFEHGTLLADPHGLLHGAHLGLRKVRYLTYLPGDRIPKGRVVDLIRRATALAQLSSMDIRALRTQVAGELEGP